MEENIRDDLRLLIYGSTLSPQSIQDQFFKILDSIESEYNPRAILRTRNKENKILTSGGRNYFTFVEKSDKDKPEVIFAGTLDKGPRNSKTPVVRVLDSNPLLANIPAMFKFPFAGERSPTWTNVIISAATIDLLKELLETEITKYISKIAE